MPNIVPAAAEGLPKINRRKALTVTGSGLIAALAAASTMPALASGVSPSVHADPILAAIKQHKLARAKLYRLYDKIDEAEANARPVYGHRPFGLMRWRNYDIGGSEIEVCRERFHSWPHADPELVEREYVDAKQRYQEQLQAGRNWDRRAGTARTRKLLHEAQRDERKMSMRMASTVPTTAAGAGALVSYTCWDQRTGDCPWHFRALRTAGKALATIAGGA